MGIKSMVDNIQIEEHYSDQTKWINQEGSSEKKKKMNYWFFLIKLNRKMTIVYINTHLDLWLDNESQNKRSIKWHEN